MQNAETEFFGAHLAGASRLDSDAAAKLACQLFGIRASAAPLPSERDQNFLLATDDGKKFVLKLANTEESRSLLEAQNAALAHLGEHLSLCPQVLPNLDGDAISETKAEGGKRHLVRLVTYLPGIPLAHVTTKPIALLRDVGRKLSQIDRALATYD